MFIGSIVQYIWDIEPLFGLVIDWRDPCEEDGSDCSIIGTRQYLVHWFRDGSRWEVDSRDVEVICE